MLTALDYMPLFLRIDLLASGFSFKYMWSLSLKELTLRHVVGLTIQLFFNALDKTVVRIRAPECSSVISLFASRKFCPTKRNILKKILVG